MKYWVFQNNQVTGPFEPEDLSQVAGYSGDTLVCPEGRKGTNMGDWQRASLVAELSVSILKASQLALAVKGAGYPALPPEPTLKDLAALGSLQEKVSMLDNMVAHLQESLRLKDDELLSVHKELQEKARQAQELAVKLGSVEERLTAVNALREGLDKAVAAEHDVESTVEKQAEVIEQLKRQLETLRDEEKKKVSELESELARVRAEDERAREQLSQRLSEDEKAREQLSQRLADASAAAAEASAKAQAAKEEAEKAEAKARDAAANAIPAPAPAALAAPVPAPAAAPFPTPMAAPLPTPLPTLSAAAAALPPALEPLAPAPATAPAPNLAASLGLATERPGDKPAGTLSLAPAAAIDPAWMQPSTTAASDPLKPLSLSESVGGLDAPSVPPPGAPIPATSAPAPLPSPIPEKPAAKPARKKAPVAVFAVVGIIGVVALAALKVMGPQGRRAEPAPAAPAALPPPPEPPKPSPEEILEDQKKQAVELLRSWQLPDGAPVAVKLETEPTPPGGLSPWFADKIRDGLFQVNFYPPKDSKSAGKSYEFEVSLAERKVAGHNPAAAALLEGKPLARKTSKGKGKGAVAKAKPKIKIKPKTPSADDGGDVLGDALDLSGGDETAKPAAPKSGGGDIIVDGSGAGGAAAPAPVAQAAPRRKIGRRAPKPAPQAESSSDDPLSLLVADDQAKPAKPAAPKASAKPESLDDLLLPGVPKQRPTSPRPSAPAADDSRGGGNDGASEDAAPAKPAARSKTKGQPADAALLEDLLKP